jgi:hypothetical protein
VAANITGVQNPTSHGIFKTANVGELIRQLRRRVSVHIEFRLDHLLPNSGAIAEAVLYRAELPRAESAQIVGTGDRQARRVVSALLEKGELTSESPRAPLRLAFPARLASRWMPGLFPDKSA